MARSEKEKHDKETPGPDAESSRVDDAMALTSEEAALLRFLHMGYVGLLASDKKALSGLEAKGLAQHLMGGWLLTSLGKSYAEQQPSRRGKPL